MLWFLTSRVLTVCSLGSLDVPGLHSRQQPFPLAAGGDGGGGGVTVGTERAQLLLGVGDEAGAVEEALRVGQVRRRLPTGVP